MRLPPCPLAGCGGPAEIAVHSGDERTGYAHVVTVRCKRCGLGVTCADEQNKAGGYALAGTGRAAALAVWKNR